MCNRETTEERTREPQGTSALRERKFRRPVTGVFTGPNVQSCRTGGRGKKKLLFEAPIEHCAGLPSRGNERISFHSLPQKKKELSERKAREQRSAVSFLAVGETRAPFSPPLKCQCICVGNQLIAIRATSTIKIPDTLIIKNAATLHCRAGFLRKGIKLKGATPSVQVQIITTFLKLYKFCNLLTL